MSLLGTLGPSHPVQRDQEIPLSAQDISAGRTGLMRLWHWMYPFTVQNVMAISITGRGKGFEPFLRAATATKLRSEGICKG